MELNGTLLQGNLCVRRAYHLFRYLDEQTFRFNEQEGQDADRFKKALRSVAGRRLTYLELLGKTASG